MIKKKKLKILISLIGCVILLFQYQIEKNKNFIYKFYNLEYKIKKCNINNIKVGSFIYAAKLAKPAVVNIKSVYILKQNTRIPGSNHPMDDLFKDFFNDLKPKKKKKNNRNQHRYASGSGVIISENGYIVTNNHVINEANRIEVILNNNKKYIAKLIGKDTSTDLALLKIDEKNLPYLKFGNSNDLKIGEWILAVGNPFKLNSTVTTGIVSAKARNIRLINDKMSIESFIQTDAAVNTGNSGGALVNLQGELVGINTGIATSTGTFSGYSFAIPSSLVQKVTKDLKKHGIVQRVMLGIVITNLNADLAERKELNIFKGVYIMNVKKNGIGYLAGLKKGDVIIEIDKTKINNTAQLQEKIATCEPGDKITLKFYRKKQIKTIIASFEKKIYKKESKKIKNTITIEGGVFENIDKSTQEKLNITNGARIKKINPGKWKKSRIPKDFIILAIDHEDIEDIFHLEKILKNKKGGILIEGFNKKNKRFYYGINW